jgi:hypothetical protein
MRRTVIISPCVNKKYASRQVICLLRKLAETEDLSLTEASLGDALSGLSRQCPALDGVILEEGLGVVFLIKTQQLAAQHNQQDDDGIYPILEKS